MGTFWRLAIAAPPADVTAGLVAVFDRIIAQMSQWDPTSDLSRFNRAPMGQWQPLPPELMVVLGAANAIAAASGGAFDPAMGALSGLWGFGASGPRVSLPDPDAIKAAQDRRLEIDSTGLMARRSGGAALDLSGIAKGYAVDAAAEWLLSKGACHFVVEIGGELRGAGVKPDGQPWWVDLEQPRGCMHAPFRVALCGLSIATSGDYRRGFTAGGKRYSHSIDPRTGWPIENDVRSVTVLHPSCMLADGWATAITILGASEGMALAKEEKLAVHMIAGAAEHMSPAFRAMMD